MKRLLLAWLLVVSIFVVPVFADEVDYQIRQYEGNLMIFKDNSARFEQTITYEFDSAYNGQFVTLGKAGKMPEGFAISGKPHIKVEVNGQLRELPAQAVRVSDVGDGYQVTIYQSGNKGDRVRLYLTWRLSNLLFPHQDVAELNWTPISDWDVPLKDVVLTVKTEQQVPDHQLWAHGGYFHPVNVTQQGDGYRISAKDVRGKLELHAYWDKAALTKADWLPTFAKRIILSQEAGIQQTTTTLELVFVMGLPLLIVFITIRATLLWQKVDKTVRFYEKFDPHQVSYQPPHNWSPLLVLSYIYDAQLPRVSEIGVPTRSPFKLTTVLQATLLDLLERGVIVFDSEELTGERTESVYLKWDLAKDVTNYELEILEMAFGDNERIAANQLFKEYQFDKTAVKTYKKTYKGQELEKKLRALGSDFTRRYEKKMSAINQALKQEITDRQLPILRCPLDEVNKREFTKSNRQFGLNAFLSFSVAVFLIVQGQWVAIFYFGLFVFNLICSILVARQSAHYNQHGVITEQGQHTIKDWLGFARGTRKMRRAATLEADSAHLWTRLAIYATLFGQGKKLQRYLDSQGIQTLTNMSVLHHYRLGELIASQTDPLQSSFSSASTTANFSVSSDSDGGFSGGGGGGGGGAF